MNSDTKMERLPETIARAAAGDAAAWEVLYQNHRGAVQSCCWRMTRNIADTEDLTQEVFLRLFLRLGTFRGNAKLGTWLHRVTVNCVLMHWRKRSTRKEISLDSEFGGEMSSGFGNPAPPAGVSEQIWIDEVLSTLTPEKRAVFILHEYCGLTHKEIAGVSDVSQENSKCRLRRARLKLREALSA